jgi:hypothetical protein
MKLSVFETSFPSAQAHAVEAAARATLMRLALRAEQLEARAEREN